MQNSKFKITIQNSKVFYFLLFRALARKLCLLLPFAFLLLPLNTAHAEGISLAVDPPILQINALSPAEISAPIVLENLGGESLSFKIDLKPFVASDQENGLIKYVSLEEANFADPLILQRVKISESEFQIGPKQKKTLTFSLSIPQKEIEADYYFSIVFLASGANQSSSNSSQNVSGIASNVLLSIGQTVAKGGVAEFSSPFFVERGPVPFTLRVKNIGGHFITPKGEIIIKNFFGNPIGRVDLAKVNVLSQSVRTIPSADFSDLFWDKKIILGPYKADLNLALSDEGPVFRREIIFFAFPIKAFIVILIAFVTLLYITVKVRTRI